MDLIQAVERAETNPIQIPPFIIGHSPESQAAGADLVGVVLCAVDNDVQAGRRNRAILQAGYRSYVSVVQGKVGRNL